MRRRTFEPDPWNVIVLLLMTTVYFFFPEVKFFGSSSSAKRRSRPLNFNKRCCLFRDSLVDNGGFDLALISKYLLTFFFIVFADGQACLDQLA